MCDCGCDHLPYAKAGIVEQAAVPKRGIMFPNRRDFAAPSATVPPQVLDIKHPVGLESINAAAGGTVSAWPRETGGSALTQGEVYTGIAQGDGKVRLFIPYPGIWQVQADAAGAGPYKILDLCNPAAALVFVGVRIFGATGAPAAAPLVAVPATFATVGVASGLALAANATRRFLYLHNTDATKTISVSFDGGVAILLSGVTLPPGAFRSWNNPGEDLFRGVINAISSGAATNLAIQEAN